MSFLFLKQANLGLFVLLCCETGPHYVALDGLELLICLPPPPEAGMVGVRQHARPDLYS